MPYVACASSRVATQNETSIVFDNRCARPARLAGRSSRRDKESRGRWENTGCRLAIPSVAGRSSCCTTNRDRSCGPARRPSSCSGLGAAMPILCMNRCIACDSTEAPSRHRGHWSRAPHRPGGEQLAEAPDQGEVVVVGWPWRPVDPRARDANQHALPGGSTAPCWRDRAFLGSPAFSTSGPPR